jgi:lysozyme
MPSCDEMAAALQNYLSLVRNAYQQEPVLYVTHALLDAFPTLSPNSRRPNSRLWIRDIFRALGGLQGRPWVLWQYANRGSVKGVSGFVDLDAYIGNPQE